MGNKGNSLTANIQFDQILNAVADGITVQDTSGKLLYANQAAAELIGYPSVRALLKTPPLQILSKFNLIDEVGRPFPITNLPGRAALAGQASSSVVIGFQRIGTKKTRWSIVKATPIFGSDGKVECAVNLFQEITKLRETTDKLLFQKSLLEAENEASQDGKLVVSPLGHTVSFNKKYLEQWGVISSQLMDKTEKERLSLLKHKVKKPKAFVSYIHGINVSPNTVASDEIEFLNGRWLERYTTPLKGPYGEYYGRIWFTRDITERRKEQHRQETFLGIASHELRTPLASIKAFLHLIQSELDNRVNNIPNYIEKIDNQTNKLNKLIKDLLDLTTVRADRLVLNMESFDFDQLIVDIVTDISPTTHHKILIEGLADKYIEADKLRLGEVFANLLRNAIKYSPEAKKITVKISSDDEKVKVSVKDYGIGIPKNKLDRIFELFFRVSNSVGISGFGVGLYISNEIVKRHRGTITIKSIEKKGSTFTVEIPLK